MEFGRKTMKLLRGHIYWPISNQKVAPIYAKLNFGTQKKSTETKTFKKCNFEERNDRIWLKNDDSTGESFPLTDFQSKSCTNLPQNEFWDKKKKKNHRNENFEKHAISEAETMEFGRKTMNLLRVLSVNPFPI